jgi:hypothetical protein
VTWRKIGFHDIIIRSSPYGHGDVHAIILDDPASNTSRTRSTSVSLKLDRDSTNDGRNGPLDESNHGPEAVSGQVSQPCHSKLQTATEKPNQAGQDTAQSQERHPEGIGDEYPSGDDLEELSGQIAQISISHDSEYATAVCLASQETMDGDVGGELAARSL